MEMLVLAVVFAVLVIVYVRFGVYIVQQSERMVIERLGSYNRTLEPGINFIIPVLDQPRSIKVRRYQRGLIERELSLSLVEEKRIDVRETVLDFPKQPVVTADNVSVEVNGALYYQIYDPKAAVYEVENFAQAIEILAKTTLRSEVGKMELDRLFESREQINERLAIVLDEAGQKWGLRVNRVEIQDIHVPSDIQESMHKQMAAERNRRATVTEARGQKEAEIEVAEGERQAAILRAEGQKQAIKEVLGAAEGTEGLAAKDVVAYLLALQYLETLPDIAKEGERVFLPYEATGVMASIEAIRDIIPQRTGG